MKPEEPADKEPKDLDRPLIDLEKEVAEEPDPKEEDPDNPDVILETHAASLYVLPPDCPFTFLYLSSEVSNRDDSLDCLSVSTVL